MTSCKNSNISNEPIQLWYYDYNNIQLYTNCVNGIAAKLKVYCQKNEIPFEVICYKEDEITYEDYCLKRNIAMAQGNVIIIDDSRYISNLIGQETDYTKIPNYNNILDCYKGKFCVPIEIGYTVYFGNKDLYSKQGIDIEQNVITYDMFTKINQQLKENANKLVFNITQFELTYNYYLQKNNIYDLICQDNIDDKVLKTAIRNTIDETIADLKKHFSIEKSEDIWNYSKTKGYKIMDDDMNAYCNFEDQYPLFNEDSYIQNKTDINKFVAIVTDAPYMSPSFFIYKKVTNEKIYELANEMLSDDCVVMGRKAAIKNYMPTIDTEKTREACKIDDEWKFIGSFSKLAENSSNELDKQTINMINDAFQMAKNDCENSSKYLFMNNEKINAVYKFIYDMINEFYKGSTLDYDKKIDEFINNFRIR